MDGVKNDDDMLMNLTFSKVSVFNNILQFVSDVAKDCSPISNFKFLGGDARFVACL